MTKIVWPVLLIGIFLTATFLPSCYYDNGTDLYPNPCDTAAVSFSLNVEPIINVNCYVCHSTSSASSAGAGIVLEGYSNLADHASSGLLMAVLDWDGTAADMPKSGEQLSLCNRDLIRAWINQGQQDN